MNTFKKLVKNFDSFKTRRLLAGSVIVFVIFLLLAPNFAYAVCVTPSCFTNWAVSWGSYFIALVAGLLIAVEAWMIGILLTISSHIVDSPAVEAGFPITLSLTNLGFVLGIIVVAIATILRYEQYGMKKILLKLVAAAILVNFSLVITGVIINFSDQLTGFFLKDLGGPMEFASNVGSAFQPQREFTFINDKNNGAISPEDLKKIQGSFAPPEGSGFSGTIGETLAPFASLVFIVATLIVMVITLFALIVMLVIRYIFLGILLVLMPLVWVAWVFPFTQSHWQKWWHNFLKWTFFSPFVVFFLWLAINAASKVNSGKGVFNFDSYKQTDSAWGAIAAVLTNIFAPLIVNMMQVSIVVGLMVGGLYAANSMGIAFAGSAYGAVKGIGKGAGAWAGRRSRQFATRPLRGEWGQKVASGLQGFATGKGLGSKILRRSGIGYGVNLAGRGLQKIGREQGEAMYHNAEKEIGSQSSEKLANNISTMSAPYMMVALNKLRERGDLDKVKNLDVYLEKGRVLGSAFTGFGQENEYKNLNKAVLTEDKARKAASKGADVAELRTALHPLISGLKKGDPSKGKNWEEVLNEKGFAGLEGENKKRLQIAQVAEIAQFNLGILPSILSQLSGKTLKRFEDEILPEVATMIDAEAVGKIKRMIHNNTFHIAPLETTSAPTTATAAPPAAPPPAAGPTPTT